MLGYCAKFAESVTADGTRRANASVAIRGGGLLRPLVGTPAVACIVANSSLLGLDPQNGRPHRQS